MKTFEGEGTGEEKSFVDTRTKSSSNFKSMLATNMMLKRDRLI